MLHSKEVTRIAVSEERPGRLIARNTEFYSEPVGTHDDCSCHEPVYSVPNIKALTFVCFVAAAFGVGFLTAIQQANHRVEKAEASAKLAQIKATEASALALTKTKEVAIANQKIEKFRQCVNAIK